MHESVLCEIQDRRFPSGRPKTLCFSLSLPDSQDVFDFPTLRVSDAMMSEPKHGFQRPNSTRQGSGLIATGQNIRRNTHRKPWKKVDQVDKVDQLPFFVGFARAWTLSTWSTLSFFIVQAVSRLRTHSRPKVSCDFHPFASFLTFCSKIFSFIQPRSLTPKFGVTVRSSSIDFDHSP